MTSNNMTGLDKSLDRATDVVDEVCNGEAAATTTAELAPPLIDACFSDKTCLR